MKESDYMIVSDLEKLILAKNIMRGVIPGKVINQVQYKVIMFNLSKAIDNGFKILEVEPDGK